MFIASSWAAMLLTAGLVIDGGQKIAAATGPKSRPPVRPGPQPTLGRLKPSGIKCRRGCVLAARAYLAGQAGVTGTVDVSNGSSRCTLSRASRPSSFPRSASARHRDGSDPPICPDRGGRMTSAFDPPPRTPGTLSIDTVPYPARRMTWLATNPFASRRATEEEPLPATPRPPRLPGGATRVDRLASWPSASVECSRTSSTPGWRPRPLWWRWRKRLSGPGGGCGRSHLVTLSAIPACSGAAADREALIGQRAVFDLVEGSLLRRGNRKGKAAQDKRALVGIS